MDKETAWKWVADNQGFLFDRVRYHKLAEYFDSTEDALQEASLRCADRIAASYNPARGALTTFVNVVLWSLQGEIKTQRATLKHGGRHMTHVVNPAEMGRVNQSRNADARNGIDAEEELRVLLTAGERGRKVEYQRRYDVLYARLVAGESWNRIAAGFGYKTAKSAEASVSKCIRKLRKVNDNETQNLRGGSDFAGRREGKRSAGNTHRSRVD